MPSAQILSDFSNFSKHLVGYRDVLSKPQFNSFQNVALSMLSGNSSSCSDMARTRGINYSNILYFFNECNFDDGALLKLSLRQMNNKTETRTSVDAFLVLDFTSTQKAGRKFEWADYLWDEEAEKTNAFGYDSLVALEYNPIKDIRKAIAFRRFYHEKEFRGSDGYPWDFEKKTTTLVDNTLNDAAGYSHAKEVLVDGEFLSGELVDILEKHKLRFTGRMKKSWLVSSHKCEANDTPYANISLNDMALDLITKKKLVWERATYRNKKVYGAILDIKVGCLNNKLLRIAVCTRKNPKTTSVKNLGCSFIATTELERGVRDIVKIYGYRWEIEVFFKLIKQNLAFNKFRLKGVGANSRWQYIVLVLANIMEMFYSVKIKRVEVPDWVKVCASRFYRVKSITIGVIIKLLASVLNGGKMILSALKRFSPLDDKEIAVFKERFL